ncbi:hypothetical protein [Pseudodesulfovibrio senegalensis]|uniref:hypothetical protein n=1 Tax=Pseudodesulfovibrio senegalensis TaxID=1721087 RepID=UPI001375E435|nr:hypothetical protein [Pseudodesulfovibrio senegalensis]
MIDPNNVHRRPRTTTAGYLCGRHAYFANRNVHQPPANRDPDFPACTATACR